MTFVTNLVMFATTFSGDIELILNLEIYSARLSRSVRAQAK